jgi:hypothetical protein
LNVRQEGFKYMTTRGRDGSQNTYDIGNWELWANRYWYETRIPNTTCPMTPVGIAAACDWALLVPCLFTGPNVLLNISDSANNGWRAPRSIFVHTYMLPHFVESTLGRIENRLPSNARFVVVTAGTDATVSQLATSTSQPLEL